MHEKEMKDENSSDFKKTVFRLAARIGQRIRMCLTVDDMRLSIIKLKAQFQNAMPMVVSRC